MLDWIGFFGTTLPLFGALFGLIAAGALGPRNASVRALGLAVVASGLACACCLPALAWAHAPASFDDNAAGADVGGRYLACAAVLAPVHYLLLVLLVAALVGLFVNPPAPDALPKPDAPTDLNTLPRFPGGN